MLCRLLVQSFSMAGLNGKSFDVARFYILLALFLLFIGGGVFMYKKVRGIRNNNPGNIRRGTVWNGMKKTQTDPDFIQFKDAVFGIRAINKILKTYRDKHGLDTVAGVVNRWAPPIENDTESYVLSVADKLEVSPDEKINIRSHAAALTTAIIKHENGIQPYDVTKIAQGVQMGWA